MNPIQHIDGATPAAVLPGAVNAGPQTNGPSDPFAAAMRSAVSAAHTPATSSNRSTRFSSAPSDGNQERPASSPSHTATSSDVSYPRVSPQAGSERAHERNAATDDPSAALVGGNVGSSSLSSEQSSQVSALGVKFSVGVQGQVATSVPTGERAVRSAFSMTGNQGSSSTVRPVGLLGKRTRKTEPTGKNATLTIINVPVVSPGVVTNVTVTGTKTPAAKSLGSNVIAGHAQADGIGGTDTIQQDKGARNPHQTAQNIEAARNVPGGWIPSVPGAAALPKVDQGHALQAATGAPGAAGTSAAGDFSGAVGAASTSSGHPDAGSGSKTAAGQIPVTLFAGAASSSDISTTASQSTDGKNGLAVSNGSAPSTHGNNSSASSIFPAVAVKSNAESSKAKGGALASSSLASGVAASHEKTTGSGVGNPTSPGIMSASTHANSMGNFATSKATSAGAHGASSDAFAALDSGPAAEQGVLLHAAPHQVAVGVTDPALGWVEVRAQRIAGQVAAALSTSSASSHAALSAVLPSMASYLQEHHAGVQHVHVETTFANGQTGTGSQGQPSPQRDGGAETENTAGANGGSNTWTAVSKRGESISAVPGLGPRVEGRRFSMHA